MIGTRGSSNIWFPNNKLMTPERAQRAEQALRRNSANDTGSYLCRAVCGSSAEELWHSLHCGPPPRRDDGRPEPERRAAHDTATPGETCRHSIFDQSGQRLEFAIPSLLIEGPGQMNLGPQLRGFGINFCGNAVIGASSRELAAGCESLLEGRAQSGWLKGHNLEPGGGPAAELPLVR